LGRHSEIIENLLSELEEHLDMERSDETECGLRHLDVLYSLYCNSNMSDGDRLRVLGFMCDVAYDDVKHRRDTSFKRAVDLIFDLWSTFPSFAKLEASKDSENFKPFRNLEHLISKCDQEDLKEKYEVFVSGKLPVRQE
jgi:hypothetical protein